MIPILNGPEALADFRQMYFSIHNSLLTIHCLQEKSCLAIHGMMRSKAISMLSREVE